MGRLTKPKRRKTDKVSLLQQLASGVAHEINNPLAVIIGKAEQLKGRVETGEFDRGSLLSFAEKIYLNGLKISQIVNSLQNYSGHGNSHPFEMVALAPFLREIGEAYQIKFGGSGIPIECVPIPPDVKIECRPIELHRAIVNLLQNAIDAMGQSGDRWIRIEIEERGEEVELRIIDNGAPISTELHPLLMTPFYSTKQGIAGAGLGLSITESIVNSHNGKFYLDTNKFQTTFVILLPKLQPKEDRSDATPKRKDNPGSRR